MTGRVHLPWFHKSSDVECFSARDRQFHRILGEDAFTYKLQIEGFAATILDGVPQAGASLDDGLAAVQAMVAIARSVETRRVRPARRREWRCVMQLGIFAKTFPRPTLEETLDAVASHGLTHVQFNMSCVGLPTLPDRIDEDLCVWIARSFTRARADDGGDLGHVQPVRSRRGRGSQDNLRRLDVLAAACRWLDTRIITLCTGTLDPEDMWKWHPDNVRRSTWETLVEFDAARRSRSPTATR